MLDLYFYAVSIYVDTDWYAYGGYIYAKNKETIPDLLKNYFEEAEDIRVISIEKVIPKEGLILSWNPKRK